MEVLDGMEREESEFLSGNSIGGIELKGPEG